jgi:hypothetical protein
MRVKTDPDLVAKYQAALAEVERLEAIPRDERGEQGYRAALLAARSAFMDITNSGDRE